MKHRRNILRRKVGKNRKIILLKNKEKGNRLEFWVHIYTDDDARFLSDNKFVHQRLNRDGMPTNDFVAKSAVLNRTGTITVLAHEIFEY